MRGFRFRPLSRQRGFLYLTTGGNGSGKTLFTLKDVRELQLKENRPVFYWGFTPKQPIHDFGWQPFEPEKWQDLPDGSICLVDECQDKMPTRAVGRPPDWIQAIAKEHRKRGFDFFLITQHSMNIDSFIRRTIASPGWHRHMKASSMGDASSELKWNYVHEQPEKPNSSKDGEHRSRPFPKEVYDWYESASLHTANKGIPRKVWMGIGAIVAAVVMIGLVIKSVIFAPQDLANNSQAAAAAQKAKEEKGSFLEQFMPKKDQSGRVGDKQPLTPAEYVASLKPRLPDLPYTAPRYDELTTPKSVPYPAVCMVMGDRCWCYTDQNTRLNTPKELCLQIVERGLYLDFKAPPQPAPAVSGQREARTASHDPQVPMSHYVKPQQPSAPPGQSASAQADAKATDDALTALAIRNAGPRLQGTLSTLLPQR